MKDRLCGGTFAFEPSEDIFRRDNTRDAMLREITSFFVTVDDITDMDRRVSSLDERRHQSALLRTLGASRSLLRNNHLFEFAGLGVFASLFAVLLHDLASFALYHFILKITYVPSLTLWVFVPLIGTAIITLTGLWSIRKVVNKSPLSILREH